MSSARSIHYVRHSLQEKYDQSIVICNHFPEAVSKLPTVIGWLKQIMVVPFARPGVCTSASCRGVTGLERQEGANGVGERIGVGGGNGDGNGDVNDHGDGD